MKKCEIESLLAKISLGDRDALARLRRIDLSTLNDSAFFCLAPWFNLSEATVREIIASIERDLDSSSGDSRDGTQ